MNKFVLFAIRYKVFKKTYYYEHANFKVFCKNFFKINKYNMVFSIYYLCIAYKSQKYEKI